MFISFHTTVYFFVNKFTFSNVYILVNTIFECHYVFFGWERSHQVRKQLVASHPGVIKLHVYVAFYMISFHVLAVILFYSVFKWTRTDNS